MRTLSLNLDNELVVDCFAGGGGVSIGLEAAIGRPVDIAINHSPEAIAMHRVNHPATKHFTEDVWRVDPREATGGRPVGLAWFSPDCTHFSKARGGKPAKKAIRGLAWVALRWAGAVRPRLIVVENVEEFKTWGPLRNGLPCPRRKGSTFKRWVAQLRALGYTVDWRELRACDYGAPTIRKRLFIVARCDGAPIVWPAPTHGPGLLPYRTAAECIDWSMPCPSIFERARPLAEATLCRIANGIRRYVIKSKQPFLVRTGHYSNITGDGARFRGQPLTRPIGTVTAHGNDKALVVPHLTPFYGQRREGENRSKPIGAPLPTQPTENRFGLVTAFLAKHFGGAVGAGADTPLPTLTARGTQTQLVTSHLMPMHGTSKGGRPMDAPLPTVTAQGQHIAEVRAFLIKYFGTATGQVLTEPMHTATAKARMGLVTVEGADYQIVDIGMRMLAPRELFRAQGFPESYIIEFPFDGKPLTKTAQIRLCGNSVPPPVVEAIVDANYRAKTKRAKAKRAEGAA